VLAVSALLLNVVAALGVITTAVVLFGLLRPLILLVSHRAGRFRRPQMDMATAVGQAARVAEETQVFGVAAAQGRRMDGLIDTVRSFFYRTQILVRLSPGIYQSAIYILVIGGLAVLYGAHSGHVASLGAVVLLLIRAGAYGQRGAAAPLPDPSRANRPRLWSACRKLNDQLTQPSADGERSPTASQGSEALGVWRRQLRRTPPAAGV